MAALAQAAAWLQAALTVVALCGQIFTVPLVSFAGGWASRLLPLAFGARIAARLVAADGLTREARARLMDAAVLAALIFTWRSPELAVFLVLMAYGLEWLGRAVAATRPSQALGAGRLEIQPGTLLIGSFAAVIVLGTLLLMLPEATQAGKVTGFVDALFTATSATCVTGLIVVDTPAHFSAFGHVVIVSLIQIGGLGIMTISTGVFFLLGRRMGVRQRVVMQEVLDSADVEELRRALLAVVRGTLLIEGLGVAILSFRFLIRGEDVFRSVWLGVFHAVSAFCNAGFALYTDSLVGFRADPVILLTVSALIVLGGLGFGVIAEVAAFHRTRRLSVHGRLALVVTALLLVTGALYFYCSEAQASMKDYSPGERLLSSWFCALTPRTAGFNTVPMAALSQGGLLLMIVLMFIGACPCSTGGGIKVSTFSIMVLAILALTRGRPCVVFGRQLATSVIQKAFAIGSISLGLVLVFTLILTLTETAPLQTLLFEVVSAFGTVGLSLDFTPQLSPIGRLLIVVLMFAGRVGPLTLALALGGARVGAELRYPEGRVMVG